MDLIVTKKPSFMKSQMNKMFCMDKITFRYLLINESDYLVKLMICDVLRDCSHILWNESE